MSDDDLIHIFVTRESTLTDEARLALKEAIQLRKIKDVDGEVQAVREDLMWQDENEKKKIDKLIEAQRVKEKLRNVFAGIFFAGGLLTAIFYGVEEGMMLMAVGIAIILLSAVNILIGRLLAAFFRND